MMINARLFVATSLAVALSMHANAHHAFSAEFDSNAPVLLKGEVTRVEWVNPHAWVHLKVEDEEGNTQQWMVEGGTPNTLFRNGTAVGVGHARPAPDTRTIRQPRARRASPLPALLWHAPDQAGRFGTGFQSSGADSSICCQHRRSRDQTH